MAEETQANGLSDEQLKKVFSTEAFRQHLIRAGLINNRDEILPMNTPRARRRRRRSKPRRTGQSIQIYQLERRDPRPLRQPVKSSPIRRNRSTVDFCPTQTPIIAIPRSSYPQRNSSAKPQTRTTKKESTNPDESSGEQAAYAKNLLPQRAASKAVPNRETRYVVTMKYFGPEILIDYDREWFEPQGESVMVMQQHCGGENNIVFQGDVKPNQLFKFESRRHQLYPFALAIYLNGMMENRLSVCCEARITPNSRVGGKRGLFSIVSIENAQPCRECRFKKRMAELEKSSSDKKNSTKDNSPKKETESSQATRPQQNGHRSRTPSPKPARSYSSTSSDSSDVPPIRLKSKEQSVTSVPPKKTSRTPSPSTDSGKNESFFDTTGDSHIASRLINPPSQPSPSPEPRNNRFNDFNSRSPEQNQNRGKSNSTSSESSTPSITTKTNSNKNEVTITPASAPPRSAFDHRRDSSSDTVSSISESNSSGTKSSHQSEQNVTNRVTIPALPRVVSAKPASTVNETNNQYGSDFDESSSSLPSISSNTSNKSPLPPITALVSKPQRDSVSTISSEDTIKDNGDVSNHDGKKSPVIDDSIKSDEDD